MVDNVEDLAGQVATTAPVDLGNLRDSAHPTVTDQGGLVYDRPPAQHRLSEAELRALHPGGHPYG